MTDEDVEVDKEDEIEGIGEVFSSETEVRKNLALFGAYSRESNKRVEGITVHMRQFLLNLNSPILNNCPAYDILKNS